MSAGLDGEQLRAFHQAMMYGAVDWNLAKAVYDAGRPSVEAEEFNTREAMADWTRVKTWVTKATGDNRTNPGPQILEDMRQALMRILRRLTARADGVTDPDPNADAMLSPSEMAPSYGTGAAGGPLAFPSAPPALPLLGRSGGGKRKSQTAKFCRCIKSVRKTIRPRKGSTKESAAIGVCVKSVLQSRGRTLRSFKCGTPRRVTTQRRK